VATRDGPSPDEADSRRPVLAAERWSRRRTVHHALLPPDRVARERRASVSVCLPARDEQDTIGPILADLMPLLGLGVVDEVVVLDESEDATGDIARRMGATVHRQSALCPELGPVQGKGDAMWRALTVLRGDVVCYLDADSEQFGAHYATALAGIVALRGPVRFAKGFYRRPFRTAAAVLPRGGGRVTEMTARPLLRAFYPELCGFLQPLAGEIAAERKLLASLPFLCGYAVDVALLIDAYRALGLAGMAQVDLDVRQNRHRSLEELGPMAHAVLGGVLSRLRAEGRLPAGSGALEVVERPPMAAYLAAAARTVPATAAAGIGLG
jgi:glucosyl-3-phosphoglycerate synthase